MSTAHPLYQELATRIIQRRNCINCNNQEWLKKTEEAIESLVSYLPHGSGIDGGTNLDLEASDGRHRIVLHTSFHHMGEGGMYDGWTDHTITVRPDLSFGLDLTISGRDRNEIKDYLHEVFYTALTDDQWFVDQGFDRLIDRDPAYALTNEWLDGGSRQVWYCRGEHFNSWSDAKRWAIQHALDTEEKVKA